MSEPIQLALIGATGLIGRSIMERLVGCDSFRLTALARREVKLPSGARMDMLLADPAHWDEAIAAISPSVLICALGTTWRKAGQDEDAFRAVDERLVLDAARAAKEAGTRHFIFISSVGADPHSKTFYLRVKGEVEVALGKLQFTRLDILRPGLLRGARQGDLRFLERAAMLLSPVVDLFLRGSRSRYRSITAEKLVEAILGLAQMKAGGRFTHEYDGLLRAVRRFEG